MEKIKNAVSFIKAHKILSLVMFLYAISFPIFWKYDVFKILWGMADHNVIWFLFWMAVAPPAMVVTVFAGLALVFLACKLFLALIIADLNTPPEERNSLSKMVLYKDLSDGKSITEAKAHADLYK